MSNQNEALVRSAYEAFARGDIPAVLAALSEDVDWKGPEVLPHAMHAHGREEVGRFFQGLVETWEDFGVEVHDYIVAGDRACVIGRADGKLGDVQTGYGFVHCWTVRDGQLVKLEEFVDPDAALLAG